MSNKTVLLVDDDQFFLEPLVDALTHEGFRVLTARTAEEALTTLRKTTVDLATVDIMLDPGDSLRNVTNSRVAGTYLCREIRSNYPRTDVFCISVVSDPETIEPLKRMGIRILTKGETPLRTVLDMLRATLTGVSYSTGRRPRHRDW